MKLLRHNMKTLEMERDLLVATLRGLMAYISYPENPENVGACFVADVVLAEYGGRK